MFLLYMFLSIVVIVIIEFVRMGGNLLQKFGNGLLGFLFSFVLLMSLFIIVSSIGAAVNTKEVPTTHPIKLASIADGTGIEGRFYGGFFIQRASINDTQHFAYYQKNDNGSYKLDKLPADQSTIWMDATPETARVDVTDAIFECTDGWWYICSPRPNEFRRADFHIPLGSIKEEFKLDAQ